MSDPLPAAPAAEVRAVDEDNKTSLHEKDIAFGDTKETSPHEGDVEEAGIPGFVDSSDSEEIILARELQKRSGILRKLRESEEWLDSKIGIETQGIDRIHEEDKKPPSRINV